MFDSFVISEQWSGALHLRPLMSHPYQLQYVIPDYSGETIFIKDFRSIEDLEQYMDELDGGSFDALGIALPND